MRPSTQPGHSCRRSYSKIHISWGCNCWLQRGAFQPSTGLCQNYIVVGYWWAFQMMASGCGFSACCRSHGTGRRKTIWTEDGSKTRSILSSPCQLSMSIICSSTPNLYILSESHPICQYSPNRSIKIHSRSQTLPPKLPENSVAH